MSNIQKYDEFLNESNKLKQFFIRASFETFNLSFIALFKLFRLAFIFSKKWSISLKETEEEYRELYKFIRFIGYNLNKINFHKQSDDEIKAFFEKISQKYEKKHKRSLIDDVVNYVNDLIETHRKKNPDQPDTKNIIEMKKLLLIINPREIVNTDIDPLGEEDWNETVENKITFQTIADLENQFYRYRARGGNINVNNFNYHLSLFISQELKNKLVGKKVTFYPRIKYNVIYKSKIVVKDALYQDGVVYLIDTDDVKHTTMLPRRNRLDNRYSPDINILD